MTRPPRNQGHAGCAKVGNDSADGEARVSEASCRRDRRIILAENVAECSAVAAHYLCMVSQYADLNNQSGMRNSLKCAAEHVKAAVASFKDFESLDAAAQNREALE
jgi:hypothetical protein